MCLYLSSLAFYVIICNSFNSISASNVSQIQSEANVDSNANYETILVKEFTQKITQRITILENNSQIQISVLNDISRALDRLESQKHDIISSIDRSEVRISHRLDDIKGDLGKTITLQEVIREDLNKLEQQHILNKIWIAEQLKTIGKRNVNSDDTNSKQSLNIVNADIEANLQLVQTTLYSLKRSTNQIEEQITDLSGNVSGLMNETNVIANTSKTYVESKSFNKAIRNVIEEMKKLEKPNVFIRTSALEANGSNEFAKDCKDIQNNQSVKNMSGVYRIRPLGADEPIFVFCDMTTDGGGWTLIQSRNDGSVDFYRDWYEYKYGFGNIANEFWLGLDHIHRITYQDIYELRIDLEDFEEDKAFAKYDAFAIGSESENYMIKLLGAYEGDAGDSMTYHISMHFSTKDNDNDRWEGDSCAVEHTGGWWYNQCESANLNGQYLVGLSPQEYKGVYWSEWQGPSYSLKRVQIKLRPHTRPN